MVPSLTGVEKERFKRTDLNSSLTPQAVLACINVTSLRQMFLQFQDLPELWKISKIDFVGGLSEVTCLTVAPTAVVDYCGCVCLQMVWVVTWLSVVVLNVDLGLAIGVVFSMMTVICRTQRYAFRFSPLQDGDRRSCWNSSRGSLHVCRVDATGPAVRCSDAQATRRSTDLWRNTAK